MASGTDKANSPQSRAQVNFKASEHRDQLVRQELEKERAATDAKTIRLKALRLAKEAEEKAELAANPPPPKPAKRRKTA